MRLIFHYITSFIFYICSIIYIYIYIYIYIFMLRLCCLSIDTLLFLTVDRSMDISLSFLIFFETSTLQKHIL